MGKVHRRPWHSKSSPSSFKKKRGCSAASLSGEMLQQLCKLQGMVTTMSVVLASSLLGEEAAYSKGQCSNLIITLIAPTHPDMRIYLVLFLSIFPCLRCLAFLFVLVL